MVPKGVYYTYHPNIRYLHFLILGSNVESIRQVESEIILAKTFMYSPFLYCFYLLTAFSSAAGKKQRRARNAADKNTKT